VIIIFCGFKQVNSVYSILEVLKSDMGRYSCTANSTEHSDPITSDFAEVRLGSKFVIKVS